MIWNSLSRSSINLSPREIAVQCDVPRRPLTAVSSKRADHNGQLLKPWNLHRRKLYCIDCATWRNVTDGCTLGE
jgi:hypothetical protein